jgi:hypothetical protein
VARWLLMWQRSGDIAMVLTWQKAADTTMVLGGAAEVRGGVCNARIC